MTECAVVLYKLPPCWGLPSLSVACVQVEAYLRLAKIQFAVQECTAPSACPTGQVPALDTSSDLVGAEAAAAAAAPPLAEFAAARLLVDYLKQKLVNLDRGLTAAQRADAAAFTALVESKLQPAIAYTTWCEAEAFAKHTRPAVGAGLPFPLSYFIPRSQSKAVQAAFAGTTAAQVYQGAAEALDALALRLGGSAAATAGGGGGSSSGGGPFFFGAQPTSLDALLYSCLAYLQAAPVVHPKLRQKVAGQRVLAGYVERLSQLAFSSSVPAAADAGLDWSAWGGGSSGAGAAGDDRYSKARSEKDSDMARKGRRWLLCAAAAVAAYVFLSGQYIQLNLFEYEYDDAEEEDDE